MQPATFRRLSVGVLGYNLGVIVWGAYVRASGSGAGCGSHWPLCNGQVVPLALPVKTLIEFTHRATSGLALLSTVALAWFAFQAYPRGNPVRRGAVAALLLMVAEAALGAGLVLLELVAENKSIARGWFMSLHLVTTFLLLASLALTVFWARGGRALRWRRQGATGALLGAGLIGLVLLGVSGAITALGDTLFPAASLAEGFRQDLSASSHLFIHLRAWHPVLAVFMGCYVTVAAMIVAAARPTREVQVMAVTMGVLFFLQLCLGVTNLVLLAPVPIQLLHLLTADFVWISFVGLTAAALQEPVVAALQGSEGSGGAFLAGESGLGAHR